MKMLRDEVSLAGKLETITMTEFRQNPGHVLTSVELGKIFLITKNGKAIAVLSKPPGETLALEIDGAGTTGYVLP